MLIITAQILTSQKKIYRSNQPWIKFGELLKI